MLGTDLLASEICNNVSLRSLELSVSIHFDVIKTRCDLETLGKNDPFAIVSKVGFHTGR